MAEATGTWEPRDPSNPRCPSAGGWGKERKQQRPPGWNHFRCRNRRGRTWGREEARDLRRGRSPPAPGEQRSQV